MSASQKLDVISFLIHILTKCSSILLKYVKIANCSVVLFISKYKGGLLSSKNGFFRGLAKFARSRHLKAALVCFLSSKRASRTPAGLKSPLELQFCQFFANLTR